MAFKDQIINLIIQGKDLFSAAASKSEKAITELADQSEKLNERLQEIEQQRKAVDTIDDLTAAVAKGKTAYTDSARALDELQAQQKAAAATAKQLSKEQQTAATTTDKLEQDYQQLTNELAQYDAQITATRDRLKQLTAEQTDGAAASEKQATAIAAAKKDLQQLEQAQTDTRTAANQLDTELVNQRQELQRISTATDEAAQAKADYATKVKLARSELSTLGSSLTKNQKSLDQQKAVLDKAGISMDKLADASEDLKQQQAGAETALANVNKRLEKHNNLLKESNKDASDFGGSIKSATASLLAMAGAYIGIDRLWESLKGILETGDRFAAFTAQMTAMMGSVEAGEQATKWIQDFANDTGSKLDTVQQAFASLKAFGIDPMNGSLQSMTDFNAKLGGSQEKLEGIILAVGQAWAKQKLQGEEILQLVERGVPVWELLEKVTGKNVTELNKLSSAGKLGRDTIKALFDEMGKQSSGQAAKSLERLGGQINVLSNNWEIFKAKVADAGLYQTAIDFLSELNAKFDELTANGKIQQVAQQVSDFFTALVKDGGASLQKTLDNITAFTKGLSVAGSAIRIVWNGITAGLSTVAMVFTQTTANMIGAWGTLLDFIGADGVAQKLRETQGALQAMSDAYKAQIEQDGQDIRDAWESMSEAMATSSEQAHERAATAAEKSADRQVEAAHTASAAMQQQNSAAKEYEETMAKVGITTVAALKSQADAAKETYDQVKQAKEQGIASAYEVEQAYLKWAEASLKVADAQRGGVPAILKTEAAANSLNQSLDALIKKYSQLSNQPKVASGYQREYAQSVDNTKNAIEELKKITESSTATDKEKAEAQKQLIKRKADLVEQTKLLNEIQRLEGENYQQLQAKQAQVIAQLDSLDRAYKQGTLTNQEYSDEKERLVKILQTVTSMMSLFDDSQEDSDQATAATTQTLAEQREELERLELQTGRATEYVNMYAAAQEALNKQFDFSDDKTADLKQRYDDLGVKMSQNMKVGNGWWKLLAQMSNAAFENERAVISQTIRYRELMDSIDSGSATMADLERATKDADYSFSKLDEQTMENLRGAIASAKAEMLDLRDELNDTVTDLQDELDELQGKRKDEALEELKQRQAELQQQLAEARENGDRAAIDAAEKALKLAQQIYNTKKQQAADEAKAAAKQAQDDAAAQKAADRAAQQTTTSNTPSNNTNYSQQPSAAAASSGQSATLYLSFKGESYPATTDTDTLAALMSSIQQAQATGG